LVKFELRPEEPPSRNSPLPLQAPRAEPPIDAISGIEDPSGNIAVGN
jgi:hypothetical protein